MRSSYVLGLMAAIVFTLAASTWPSAAVVIYPWCANYGGRMSGAQNCGFTSWQQCELTRAAMAAFAFRIPGINRTHRRKRLRRLSGVDRLFVTAPTASNGGERE